MLQDDHGLLVDFESFSTDAILLNLVDDFKLNKATNTTINGPKVSVLKRTLVVHIGLKRKLGNFANAYLHKSIYIVKHEKIN